MPTYRYVGRGSDGRQVSGQLEANSEELAAESLMGKGISVVHPTICHQSSSTGE